MTANDENNDSSSNNDNNNNNNNIDQRDIASSPDIKSLKRDEEQAKLVEQQQKLTITSSSSSSSSSTSTSTSLLDSIQIIPNPSKKKNPTTIQKKTVTLQRGKQLGGGFGIKLREQIIPKESSSSSSTTTTTILVVRDIVPNGPADKIDDNDGKALIRKGDVILKVNGMNVIGWSLERMVKEIRGMKGKEMSLDLERDVVEEEEDEEDDEEEDVKKDDEEDVKKDDEEDVKKDEEEDVKKDEEEDVKKDEVRGNECVSIAESNDMSLENKSIHSVNNHKRDMGWVEVECPQDEEDIDSNANASQDDEKESKTEKKDVICEEEEEEEDEEVRLAREMALMVSSNPKMTPKEIRKKLQTTGSGAGGGSNHENLSIHSHETTSASSTVSVISSNNSSDSLSDRSSDGKMENVQEEEEGSQEVAKDTESIENNEPTSEDEPIDNSENPGKDESTDKVESPEKDESPEKVESTDKVEVLNDVVVKSIDTTTPEPTTTKDRSSQSSPPPPPVPQHHNDNVIYPLNQKMSLSSHDGIVFFVLVHMALFICAYVGTFWGFLASVIVVDLFALSSFSSGDKEEGPANQRSDQKVLQKDVKSLDNVEILHSLEKRSLEKEESVQEEGSDCDNDIDVDVDVMRVRGGGEGDDDDDDDDNDKDGNDKSQEENTSSSSSSTAAAGAGVAVVAGAAAAATAATADPPSEEEIAKAEKLAEIEKQCPSATPAERERFLEARNDDVDAAVKQLEFFFEWREEHKLDEAFSSIDVNSEDYVDEELWNLSCRVALEKEAEKKKNSKEEDKEEVKLPRLVQTYKDDEGEFLKSSSGNKIIHVLPAQIDTRITSSSTYAQALAIYLDPHNDRSSSIKSTVVIDVRAGKNWYNPSPASIIPFIRTVSSLLNNCYPERLHQCIIFPLPRAAVFVWRTIKAFLDPKTGDKMQVISGSSAWEAPIPKGVEEFVDESVLNVLEERRVSLFL